MAAIQASIPPEHLGKVIATVTSLVSLGIPFGMAVAGPVAELVGISTWMVGAGVTVFILGTLSWVFFRERRKS
jgi:DHA3 family macrolide efflux protein-like MFS transporter